MINLIPKNMTKSILTIHKNTKEQRRSKALRFDLKKSAGSLAQLKDISGYAIVVWTDEHTTNCEYSVPQALPSSVLPEFAKQILAREMQRQDTNIIINERFD